jgi:hypothetical protein
MRVPIERLARARLEHREGAAAKRLQSQLDKDSPRSGRTLFAQRFLHAGLGQICEARSRFSTFGDETVSRINSELTCAEGLIRPHASDMHNLARSDYTSLHGMALMRLRKKKFCVIAANGFGRRRR